MTLQFQWFGFGDFVSVIWFREKRRLFEKSLRCKCFGWNTSGRGGARGEERERGRDGGGERVGREKEEMRLQQPREILGMITGPFHSNFRGLAPSSWIKKFLVRLSCWKNIFQISKTKERDSCSNVTKIKRNIQRSVKLLKKRVVIKTLI